MVVGLKNKRGGGGIIKFCNPGYMSCSRFFSETSVTQCYDKITGFKKHFIASTLS